MTQTPAITPVILCGGSGTRLWPLSRKALPKPFLPLLGDRTLFQQAIDRCADRSVFDAPMVVAGEAHIPHIEAQSADVEGLRLVVEPMGRNTAPAIALAAHALEPETVMLVCPSDHHIADAAAFADAAKRAAALAQEGRMVAFGIAADRPETGYGYIKAGAKLPGGYAVDRFVEKPDEATAQSFLDEGGYSWNGGIFVFRAGDFLDELRTHRPRMAAQVESANDRGLGNLARYHPNATEFAKVPAESVDYAVMENTAAAAMVPVDMGWSDIGNWSALREASEHDDSGNAHRGNVQLVDCRNTLVRTDGPRVSAVGLENVMIVVDKGEVLVTTADGAQAVGKLDGAANQ